MEVLARRAVSCLKNDVYEKEVAMVTMDNTPAEIHSRPNCFMRVIIERTNTA